MVFLCFSCFFLLRSEAPTPRASRSPGCSEPRGFRGFDGSELHVGVGGTARCGETTAGGAKWCGWWWGGVEWVGGLGLGLGEFYIVMVFFFIFSRVLEGS